MPVSGYICGHFLDVGGLCSVGLAISEQVVLDFTSKKAVKSKAVSRVTEVNKYLEHLYYQMRRESLNVHQVG